MEMDIEEYVREEPKLRNILSPSSKAAAKRKRNDDMMRNIPDGATNGFVSVKDLLLKGSSGSKKRKKLLDFDPTKYESDSDDRDIEAGLFAPRRTASLSTTSKGAKEPKKPRRSKTIATDSTTGKTSRAKRTKKKEPSITELTASQIEKLAEEDSDDLDIQAGLLAPPKPAKKKAPAKRKTKPPPKDPSSSPPPRTPPRKKVLPEPSSSPEIPLEHSPIDLPASFAPKRQSTPLFLPSSPDRPLSLEIQASSSYHSQPDDLVLNSPAASPSRSPPSHSRNDDVILPDDKSMAWLIEDDSEPELQPSSSPPRPGGSSTGAIVNGETEHDSDIEFVGDIKPSSSRTKQPPIDSSPIVIKSSSPPCSRTRNDMPPPAALPTRFLNSSPAAPDDSPIPLTYAVRAPGRQTKKAIPTSIDSSPLGTAPPRKRLQKQRDEPTVHSESDSDPQPKPKRKKRKFQDAMEMQKHNPWVEFEASHSGDERSAGDSDDEVVANSSDHEFLRELPETQVSASYDQTAIYRQSLLSQAPGRAPLFAKGPARRGAHRYNFAEPSRRRHVPSSSPDRANDEPDEYIQGSFVVDDDAEISYITSLSD